MVVVFENERYNQVYWNYNITKFNSTIFLLKNLKMWQLSLYSCSKRSLTLIVSVENTAIKIQEIVKNVNNEGIQCSLNKQSLTDCSSISPQRDSTVLRGLEKIKHWQNANFIFSSNTEAAQHIMNTLISWSVWPTNNIPDMCHCHLQ